MRRRLRAAAFFVAFIAFGVNVECAGAPTTYVATSGSDANACSLVLPCRSFAGALAQTSTGGEIVVLDSGGYGTVVIDKSVAIVAPDGVYAGVSVFTGVGIAIVSPAAQVTLSGLTIVALTPSGGISSSATADVSIERVTISGVSSGITLCCQPGTLSVQDSTIVLAPVQSGAIEIQGPTKMVLANSRIINAHSGLNAWGDVRAAVVDSIFAFGYAGVDTQLQSEAAPSVSVNRSVLSDNVAAGIRLIGPGSRMSIRNSLLTRTDQAVEIDEPAIVDIVSSVVADSSVGISLQTPSAKVTISDNTVTRSNIGIANSFGGVIESRGSNVIRNNGTDLSGPAFVPLSGL